MDFQTEYLEHKIGQLMEGRPGIPADWLDDLCASRGLMIRCADLGPDRFGALDLWQATIFVNSRLPEMIDGQANVWGARNATVGHELGHGFLHRPEMLAGVELTDQHEAEAWAFADALLMPRDMLRADPSVRQLIQHWQYRQQMRPRQLDYELDEAADRFRVSRTALGMRLVRLNLLEKADRGWRVLGRPSAPTPRPPQSSQPIDSARQLVAH